MTLVELMVGLAIGLFIVATALGLAMAQLRDGRAVLQASRVSVNLQAAADLVARDLRRAGYRGDAAAGIARDGAAVVANPYADVSWSDPDATLKLTFSLDTTEDDLVESTERLVFRLRNGVIEMAIGNAPVQAMTDADALYVTRFLVTPVWQELALDAFCDQPCPASIATCPRQLIRRYDILLAARSKADATLVRELRTSVRVRNDVVTGTCPS